MPELENIDWPFVTSVSIPIGAFVLGYLLGRRGSSASSAVKIAKAINRVSKAIEDDKKRGEK